jgi:hypothetical protein
MHHEAPPSSRAKIRYRDDVFRSRVGSLVVASALASSAEAFAQGGEAAAAAEVQFERGLKAMEAGRYDEGCPALSESVRLDPRAGAVFTLAECETKWGRIASASAHYDDYLARYSRMSGDEQSKQRGREKIAVQRQSELKPRIPQLTLVLPPGAPAGAVVKRDGIELGAPSLGVALPVDPGAHVIVVEAPGRAVRESSILIVEGEVRTVTVEIGAEAKPPWTPGPGPGPGPAPETGSSLRTWSYVGFGVGVVGIGLGTAFGIVTLGKKSTVDSQCKGLVCTAEGKAAADAGKTTGLVSTISFAVGGAGAALGVLLLVLAPPASRGSTQARPALSVSNTGATLGAEGWW